MREITDQYLLAAKKAARNAVVQEIDELEYGYKLDIHDLYIVWFTFTLGNYKALLSSDLFDNGIYIEVTHNHNKDETYVDIYKKQANLKFENKH